MEVTLKVCAKRQSDTSKSSRFIFIWCKICSFVSKVIVLTPSPFFVHYNTIIWSCPNWRDLKSVQLYALSYPINSVKLHVLIFCHAWIILEWHYVQLIIVYIPGAGLHGLQAMTIYMYRRRIKHVVQGVEMYGFSSMCHPFHAHTKTFISLKINMYYIHPAILELWNNGTDIWRWRKSQVDSQYS